MSSAKPHVAILGAGPIGLEAALAAADRGLPFTLYEAGEAVAANVRSWGHVRLFTPWELDVSPRMRRHLEAAGQAVPANGDCPTGAELVERVFEPLAALPAVAPFLRLGARVVAVGREGLLKHEEIGTPERRRHPFRLLVADADGGERVEQATAVLDCTGTYGHPNWLGDGGIPAPGERRLGERIERRIPDVAAEPGRWAGQTVLLAGAGHSAQTAAVELAALAAERPGTRVLWALRRPEPRWEIQPDDPLPERSRLTARAAELANGASPAVETLPGTAVEALAARNGRVAVTLRAAGSELRTVEADRVLALTGSVGDHLIYRQLQIHECYATSGPMKLAAALLGAGGGDCLAQTSHGAETLESPEPDFYLLGSKSYGRNNTFLMRVGWEQVDEVYGLLAS